MVKPGVVRWWWVLLSNSLGSLLILVILGGLARTTYFEYQRNRQSKDVPCANRKKSATKQLSRVIISVLSVGVLYFFVLFWISLRLLFGKSLLSCIETVRVAAPMYQLSKAINYFLFFERISTVYSGSVYEYNSTWLWLGYGLLLIGNTVVVVCDAFMPTVHNRRFGPSMSLCIASFPPWLGALALLVDIVGSLGSLYLFTKPLRQMMRVPNRETSTLKMTRLAMKYTVLTFIAVITTAVHLLLLAVESQALLAPIDMVINLICFAGLTNWFDDFFYGHCQWTFTCLRCCFEESDLKRVSHPKMVSTASLTE